jgi:hypothetical protein
MSTAFLLFSLFSSCLFGEDRIIDPVNQSSIQEGATSNDEKYVSRATK